MPFEGKRALRILAVDDSRVMRGVMRTVFELHASQGDPGLPKMELCGLVRDGVEALEAVRTLAPDVLLLDLEMPRMNGLQVLEQLRTLAPRLPVIMCSAHTERGARSTLDALALGAKDYVMKPGQQKDFASALDTLMEQLLPKIAVLAGAGWSAPVAREAVRETSREMVWAPPPARMEEASSGLVPVGIVVIGISTGGPSALEQMLPMLPKDFPVPLMIVQHMPKLFTGALADRLNRMCAMPVEQARDGASVRPGTVLLAPGDAHMEIVAIGSGMGRGRGGMVKLHQGPPLNSCMPSADYLLSSAAAMYGAGTLALIMTGMGSDGLAGAMEVKAARGTVIAQDEATSAVWGMPGRVVRAGVASATIALPALAGAIMQRVQAGRISPRAIPSAITNDTQREGTHGLL